LFSSLAVVESMQRDSSDSAARCGARVAGRAVRRWRAWLAWPSWRRAAREKRLNAATRPRGDMVQILGAGGMTRGGDRVSSQGSRWRGGAYATGGEGGGVKGPRDEKLMSRGRARVTRRAGRAIQTAIAGCFGRSPSTPRPAPSPILRPAPLRARTTLRDP
jgi:hypothetical protein